MFFMLNITSISEPYVFSVSSVVNKNPNKHKPYSVNFVLSVVNQSSEQLEPSSVPFAPSVVKNMSISESSVVNKNSA